MVDKEKELSVEEQEALRKGEEVEEPPIKEPTLPEGEEAGEPETPEEKATRLEEKVNLLTESEDRLKKESTGRLNEIISLRGRARGPKEIHEPKVEKPLFEGRDDLDALTIADAKTMRENYQRDSDKIFMQTKLMVSEDIARGNYEDYDEAALKFDEMCATNPALMGVAYMEKNPGEYIYKKGKEHPELIAKAELETKRTAKQEVIDKITKPRPKFPKGGGGGAPGGPVDAEKMAEMSPSALKDFKAKNPEKYAKIIKELGEAE